MTQDSLCGYGHVMIVAAALEKAGAADREKVDAADPRDGHDDRPGPVFPRRQASSSMPTAAASARRWSWCNGRRASR